MGAGVAGSRIPVRRRGRLGLGAGVAGSSASGPEAWALAAGIATSLPGRAAAGGVAPGGGARQGERRPEGERLERERFQGSDGAAELAALGWGRWIWDSRSGWESGWRLGAWEWTMDGDRNKKS